MAIVTASTTDNIKTVATKSAATTISAADKAASKAQTNYQDFLKLLTTQLQNQDPSAPADTNQLTQQIATLSQVEQQVNTNKNLEKLIAMFSTSNLSNTSSYIGKQVESVGNQTMLESGKATIAYDLDAQAATATVNVLDANGGILRTITGGTNAGRNQLVWDGKDGKGNDVADGAYRFQVVAKDTSQKDVASTSYTIGTVTSIDTQNGSSVLKIGSIAVPMDKVLSITSSSVSGVDVSYIGKQVETVGNQGMLTGGVAGFLYNLDKAAASVDVTISDARGNKVVTTPGTKLAGRNEVFWNGKDANNNQMEDGVYSIKVTAKDTDGTVINSTTRTMGIVTSIDTKDGKPILSLGDITVGLDKVLSVRQASTIASDAPAA